jgi:hypothetical protein
VAEKKLPMLTIRDTDTPSKALSSIGSNILPALLKIAFDHYTNYDITRLAILQLLGDVFCD